MLPKQHSVSAATSIEVFSSDVPYQSGDDNNYLSSDQENPFGNVNQSSNFEYLLAQRKQNSDALVSEAESSQNTLFVNNFMMGGGSYRKNSSTNGSMTTGGTTNTS